MIQASLREASQPASHRKPNLITLFTLQLLSQRLPEICRYPTTKSDGCPTQKKDGLTELLLLCAMNIFF